MQKKRTADEILEFLKPFAPWIRSRLESIPLVKLSSNEVEITKNKIEECKEQAKSLKIKVKEQELKWKSALKVWNAVSKKNLKQSSLMVDGGNEGSYNGIQIWNPEEYLQEEEKILTGDEENETDEETNQE